MSRRMNLQAVHAHVLTAAVTVLFGPGASALMAAALTWDADGSVANGTTAGDGIWDKTTTNTVWYNGTADIYFENNWSSAGYGTPQDSVTFAGSDGSYAITVARITDSAGASQTDVQKITFNASGYTLSNPSAATAATIRLFSPTGTNGDNLVVASGKTAAIGSNVTVQLSTAGSIQIGGGGTLNLSGGTIKTTNTYNPISIVGGTTVNVNSGGTLQTTNNSNDNINLTNGTLSVTAGGVVSTGNANFILAGSNSSTATLTLDGGNVTLGTTSNTLAVNSTGTNRIGIINLNSGTLLVGAITAGTTANGSTSTFNFNGGTLKANQSTAAFMSGLTAANIKAGGALIDSNNKNITIAQPLVHDIALGATTDGGLTKSGGGTLTLSGANTYVGNTTISGGQLTLTGSLLMDISAPGNSDAHSEIGGSGAVDLSGALRLDVTDVPQANAQWTLVNVDSLTAETFGANFSLSLVGTTDTPFSKGANGHWTLADGQRNWTFEQTSGVLSVTVPEPFSLGALGLSLTTLALARRHRRD